MWLLLQALLLLQVNLSTSTFCKNLSTTGMYDRLCKGQEDDWFASNDAYLLSATCDSISVSVEISKNPESMYAKYLSSVDVYIIDYNCTGDDSIMFPDEVDYLLPSDSETKVVPINTTREISCIITGCVYYTTSTVYCWSHLESIAQCIIKAPALSISSTISSSPVSPSISHSAITSQTSVTKLSDNTTSSIIEASSEARVISIAWSSELSASHLLNLVTPKLNTEAATVSTKISSMLIESTAAAAKPESQLNPIVIAILVIVAVVMVTGTVSLCFVVVLIRRWKIHKSAGATVFEYNWRTSFTNNDVNRISITESLVTITQSLELTLPTSNGDPTQVLVTSEHQSTEYIIKDGYESGLRYSDIVAEGERQSNEDTQTMSDKMAHRCFDSSSLSHNDTMSCTSRSSTDGYIVTSDTNQHDRHTGQAGDKGRVSNGTTALPSLDSEKGNNDEELFTLSNESLRQPTSKDYITEHNNSAIVHVCLHKDEERNGERYDSESDCYLSEGSGLFNATVNDYVFQKKMNNRLVFPTDASSGYLSDHTPNTIGTSYIPGGSSTSYVDSCSVVQRLPDLGYDCRIDDDGYLGNSNTYCVY